MDNYYDSSSSETDCESFGHRRRDSVLIDGNGVEYRILVGVNHNYVYSNLGTPPRIDPELLAGYSPSQFMSNSPIMGSEFMARVREWDNHISDLALEDEPNPSEPEPEPEPYEPIARRLRPRPRPVYRRWPY